MIILRVNRVYKLLSVYYTSPDKLREHLNTLYPGSSKEFFDDAIFIDGEHVYTVERVTVHDNLEELRKL